MGGSRTVSHVAGPNLKRFEGERARRVDGLGSTCVHVFGKTANEALS